MTSSSRLKQATPTMLTEIVLYSHKHQCARLCAISKSSPNNTAYHLSTTPPHHLPTCILLLVGLRRVWGVKNLCFLIQGLRRRFRYGSPKVIEITKYFVPSSAATPQRAPKLEPCTRQWRPPRTIAAYRNSSTTPIYDTCIRDHSQ